MDWFQGKKIQETPMIFMGKLENPWFPVGFPVNQSIDEPEMLGHRAMKKPSAPAMLLQHLGHGIVPSADFLVLSYPRVFPWENHRKKQCDDLDKSE